MNEITRRADALARGTTDRILQHAVSTHDAARLWPGVLMNWPDFHALSDAERHRVTAIEAARKGGSARTLSHTSALAVHRIPMLSPDFTRIHFTSPSQSRKTKRVKRHQGILLDDERVTADGIAVTSLARSICDVARAGTFEQAVVVLDAGLRKKVKPVDIATSIERLQGYTGIDMLRRANDFADRLSESVGESFCRALMSSIPEMPTPRLQVTICNRSGAFIARVDFLIGDNLVGEFDGLVKYSGGLGDDPPSKTVVKEKLREDALRAEGYVIVRWVWADLMNPARFRATVLDALRRAGQL